MCQKKMTVLSLVPVITLVTVLVSCSSNEEFEPPYAKTFATRSTKKSPELEFPPNEEWYLKDHVNTWTEILAPNCILNIRYWWPTSMLTPEYDCNVRWTANIFTNAPVNWEWKRDEIIYNVQSVTGIINDFDIDWESIGRNEGTLSYICSYELNVTTLKDTTFIDENGDTVLQCVPEYRNLTHSTINKRIPVRVVTTQRP